jgi:hypothetical protein
MPATARARAVVAKRQLETLVLLLVPALVGCGGHEPQKGQMSQSKPHVSDETRRFHQLVRNGSLEEVRAALAHGTAPPVPIEQSFVLDLDRSRWQRMK